MIIWFDMDGTIADFYSVDNWLKKIQNYDPSPYRDAAALVNLSRLARQLNKLQAKGIEVGIISWGSKDSTDSFLSQVRQEKINWLSRHLKSVHFNEVFIVDYGTSKNLFRRNENDILFDDNKTIRNEWGKNAFSPDRIFEILSLI